MTGKNQARAAWRDVLRPKLRGFRAPRGLTSQAAQKHFGPGVTFRTSMVGLHRLRGRYPASWHLIVWKLTPPGPRHVPRTVHEILGSSLFAQGMPRSSLDFERLKRYRASARRVGQRIGRQQLERITEQTLTRLRTDWTAGANGLAAKTVARDLSLLRRLCFDWATEAGVRPLVKRVGTGPKRRLGSQSSRRTPTPHEIAHLISELDAAHRSAVALAAGAGLTEAECLALRYGDLDWKRSQVHAHSGRTRGRAGLAVDRFEPIASWALEELRAAAPWGDHPTKESWVFPGRKPGSPRTDLNRGVRTGAKAVYGGDVKGLTLGGARRLWQAVQRAGGMPRLAVRQSFNRRVLKNPRRAPPWYRKQRGLLGRWTQLTTPPVSIGATPRVPKKAPKRCRPGQAEVTLRPQKPPEKPAQKRRASRPMPATTLSQSRDPDRAQAAWLAETIRSAVHEAVKAEMSSVVREIVGDAQFAADRGSTPRRRRQRPPAVVPQTANPIESLFEMARREPEALALLLDMARGDGFESD